MFYLQPKFGEELAPIEVCEPRFAIGSEESAFAHLSKDRRDQLDKRHARIEQEAGKHYLVDLGSGSSTRINGKTLEQTKAELCAGDQIQLGSDLTFEVCVVQEALDATQVLAAPPALQLTLTPTSVQGPQAPLAVTQFPFLVAKNQGHFATYQAEFRDIVGYLSRRHAQFFQVGSQIYVEDLGSTNGTVLNGRPVIDEAEPVSSGDVVRFGHDAFTFEIQVGAADDPLAGKVPEGTVLISSAGSFLDIYVDAANQAQPQNQSSNETGDPKRIGGQTSAAAHRGAQEAPDSQSAGGERSSSLPEKLSSLKIMPRRLWGLMKQRWANLPLGPELRYLVTYSIPVLLLVGVLVISFRDNRPSQIESLVNDGESYAALELAAEYLQAYPDDEQVQIWSEQALSDYLPEAWTLHVSNRDLNEAKRLIADTQALAPYHAENPTVTLLSWLTDLHQYDATEQTVSAVQENALMRRLIMLWDLNTDPFSRRLRELADADPRFQSIHVQSMSMLRSLQDDSKILLGAIQGLHADLTEYFESGRHKQSIALVEDFALEYPRIADTALLKEDLVAYMALFNAHQHADLVAYVELADTLTFHSKFVEQRALPLLAERDDVEHLYQLLDQAVTTWQRGRWAQATTLLKELPEDRWAEPLRVKNERYNKLVDEFQKLLGLVQEAEYPDVLIDFYTQLDPDEDRFMYGVLQDDFNSHAQHALAQARTLTAQAQTLWQEYGAQFDGISGGLRLEPHISQSFRDQASALHNIWETTEQAMHIYRLLDRAADEDLQEQYGLVVSEINRQRVAFESLRAILGDDLVDAKLTLLPNPQRHTVAEHDALAGDV